jgi:uncharacterized membrane protein
MSPPTSISAVATGDLEIASHIAEWIEIAAIVVIAGAVVLAFGAALVDVARSQAAHAVQVFKRVMAGGLLMGLDLLIAADVIKTVTIQPTLENITVLGLLILIRTFLSWSLILEVDGRWPWQQRKPKAAGE